jgi:uncharacterized protein YcnI
VRRALVVSVLAGIGSLLLAAPAGAHPGIENPFLPVGVPTTVALGVPSEQPSPLVGIDVSLPPDFTLLRVDSLPGWQSDSGLGRLRFFNGNVAQGGYAQFTFSGVFSQKRVVSLPIVTRAADGTAVDWSGPPSSLHPAALLFPGYPPGSAPVPGLAAAGSRGGGSLVVVSAVAAAAALGLGLLVARRPGRVSRR